MRDRPSRCRSVGSSELYPRARRPSDDVAYRLAKGLIRAMRPWPAALPRPGETTPANTKAAAPAESDLSRRADLSARDRALGGADLAGTGGCSLIPGETLPAPRLAAWRLCVPRRLVPAPGETPLCPKSLISLAKRASRDPDHAPSLALDPGSQGSQPAMRSAWPGSPRVRDDAVGRLARLDCFPPISLIPPPVSSRTRFARNL